MSSIYPMPQRKSSRKKTSDLKSKIILVTLSVITIAIVLFSYAVYSTKLSYNSKAAPMESPDEVVSGYPARYEDWPFLVELVDKRKIDINNPKSAITNRTEAHICGGSLLSSKWVITARHCFLNTGIGKENLAIIFFRNNFSNASVALVSEIFMYIDPNISDETDLTLIELKNTIEVVETVSLTDTFEYPKFTGNIVSVNPTDVTIAGWGRSYQSIKYLPANPNETVLTTISPVFNDNIYAQDTINQSGACAGDSGGPLITYQKNKRVLVGITSGVLDGCGNSTHFVNLTKYISWIKSITGIDKSQGSFIGNPIPKPVFRKPTIVKDRWYLDK